MSNETQQLIAKLEYKAELYSGQLPNLIYDAAAMIRKQAARIAELERHLAQRDDALEKVDRMLNE